MRINHRGPKYALCLLTIFLLLVCASSNAQKNTAVNLPGGLMRLDTLLNRVSRQTHQHFSLNTKRIVPSTSVNWKAGNYTLEQFLQKLCTTYSITYNRSGYHIILRELPRKPAKIAAAKPKTTKPAVKTIRKTSSRPIARKPVAPSQPIKTKPLAETPVQTDSIVIADAPQPVEEVQDAMFLPASQTPDTITIKKDTAQKIVHADKPATKDSVIHITPAKPRTSKWWHPFAQSGLAADDVFYIAPTLKAGFKFAYGILSWNTNFKISGFRYGGGTSLRLSEDMRVHADITFGKLSKDYDTLGQKITVKTKLTRILLFLENRITGKFYLQYGPMLNLLKTEYYLNDMPLGMYRPEETVDRKYHYIKPIYTLRNTYAPEKPSNRKSWIGAQVGIYYRFK